MEGHLGMRQRLEDISYIDFWAACDTYVKTRKAKVDKLLHELKNPITR